MNGKGTYYLTVLIGSMVAHRLILLCLQSYSQEQVSILQQIGGKLHVLFIH